MTAAYAKLADVTDPRSTAAAGGGEPDVGFSADELAEMTGGRLLVRSDRPILGAAVDSREIAPGNLFVALPGERTDGHRFIGAALDMGAAAILVAEQPDAWLLDGRDATAVLVPDPLRGLQAIATAWRTRFDPLVVGVTGSIAKTSTKEAVAAVLGAAMPTLRNEGNANNEIGLPLTVLRLRREHRAAVLEMGMYVGGEIADLARIGRPEIGIVTAVQPVHLSRIGTIEAIEQAKGELLEALPDDGVAILNADDERVRRMASRTRARAVTYGFAPDADVRADDVVSRGGEGMRFRLVAPGVDRQVAIPSLGRLAVHNALAGAAVGLAAGIPIDTIVTGLAAGWSAPHRGELIRTREVTIVDDSYNASPGSVEAALELLSGMDGRRVAVLGEMLELGTEHEAGHRRVGEIAARLADRLVVVGDGAAEIAAGARSAGMKAEAITLVGDPAAARDHLLADLRPGDVVLVKASRGIALEVLVADLESALTAESPAGR
ncbi:MAG TPA: UDP-N-acetylmuramoyl-tripeptide--D-alanyl-D-alanine ligase [Candidatus Limnocylindrales bacterium]|nr:UDP-N-acetylmuramoyl-tripeptide--D-alanyl-D-alanine ligase [Candidatus Limnocylindrales bacterium]